MSEKTDKFTFNQELIGYYKEKVLDLEKSHEKFREYRIKKRDSSYSSDEVRQAETQFDEQLNSLLYFAYPKIKKSSNIEIDDDLKNSIDDSVYTVNNLSLDQKKRLLYLIRDLFEALNITSLEREKWETQGIGTTDKESGQK